ncbi:MAG: DUF4367 domain-containing protein [Lachnospiraceae bacterium]|nr:DUF4367 domain-containing protein [Lachnospiraceae bacterium]
MQPLLQSKSPVRYRKRLKFRYLLVAVLILLFGGMTTLANPDVRERIGKYFEQLFDDHTDVSLDVPEQHKKKEFVKVKPTYIPEGYTQIEKTYTKQTQEYILSFVNENGDTLHYTQSLPEQWENSPNSITSDGVPAKTLDIGGFPGYLLSDEHGVYSLIYITDNYTFYVGGKVDAEELIKMIQSLQKE